MKVLKNASQLNHGDRKNFTKTKIASFEKKNRPFSCAEDTNNTFDPFSILGAIARALKEISYILHENSIS